ncbi:MAG: M24 family metallopeptidase [Gaiellales bacterium]
MNHAGRLQSLSQRLPEIEVDALLVTDPANVRYLTGYAGSNGVVIVNVGGSVFLTDFRYLERVTPLRQFIDVRQSQQDIIRFTAAHMAELAPGATRIGFEAAHLTVARHQLLATAEGVELVATTEAVERLRVIKDADELDLIRRAAAMLEPVYAALAREGLSGRRETDVAWRIQELVREAGGERVSFDSIVASGERGAQPHAEPEPVEIEPGTLVTIDLGSVVGGYASDCTRTFATGHVDRRLAEIYDVCLRAQVAALEAVKPGAICEGVDAVARDLITEAGYGEMFQHGTGHGVGLSIHEAPRLARGQTATLEQGMVVTVEPGIYLPGHGGVRIEDLVIVTAGGAERLTGYPKELVEVG